MMIRNLKALGLALVAVFAMSAMAASAASAQQGFLTSDGPVTLTGSETGGPGANVLKAFGLEVECAGSTYTGHKVNSSGLISSGETTVTLTPKYANCIVRGLNWPATVDMNGCDYVAHLGQTTGEGVDTYGVTFDLVCPKVEEVTKEATLTIWTPGKHNGVNPAMCVIHFGEAGNQDLPGAHATDTTNGHIDLTGTVTGIDATKTKSTEDPILCPHATTTTGQLVLDVTVSGDDQLGDPTSIGLSHN